MTPKPPPIFLICLFITGAAWLMALSGGRGEIALAGAAIISILCAAIVVLRLPRTAGREGKLHKAAVEGVSDEAAEFRRTLFELCAALKLSICFLEEHLRSKPDVLLEELERMKDNISAFVNGIARPVRLYPQRHWPWGRRPQR